MYVWIYIYVWMCVSQIETINFIYLVTVGRNVYALIHLKAFAFLLLPVFVLKKESNKQQQQQNKHNAIRTVCWAFNI